MAALLAMAVYDTEENQRTWMTRDTLLSLDQTVDFKKHRLIVVDNASCKETKDLLEEFSERMGFMVITNEENLGTAKAINKAWKYRRPQEHLIKMDNDVVIHQSGWVDLLEEAIMRAPEQIGILCLKRKDLAERPYHDEGNWAHSKLHMLKQEAGQRCIVIEQVNHAMGTCQMYNYRLIEKIGGLYQMDGLYGFDDSLAAARCQVAGFISAFIPYIEIDHIDPGTTPYQTWKHQHSGEMMAKYQQFREEYIKGKRDIYYPID